MYVVVVFSSHIINEEANQNPSPMYCIPYYVWFCQNMYSYYLPVLIYSYTATLQRYNKRRHKLCDMNFIYEVMQFFRSHFLLTIVCGASLFKYSQATTRQRWYYTGKFTHDVVKEEVFEGTTLDLFALYNQQTENQSYLYAGGLLLFPHNSEESVSNVTYNLEREDLSFLKYVTGSNFSVDIKSTVSYKIFLNSNYHRIPRLGAAEIFQAEIGLFDHDIEKYVEMSQTNISLGTLHASLVVVPSTDSSIAPTLHRIMWTWDTFGRSSILHHTWHRYNVEATPSTTAEAAVVSDSICKETKNTKDRKLRVMTYNLWHNNPPSWVYHDKR